jgi:1,4-alpha-glucan branching enzyme
MSAFSSFFFTSVLIIVLILQIIYFTRGPFLFVFNFNPDASYQLYSVGVDEAGEYQLILNTDETKYGGRGELTSNQYMKRTSDNRVGGCRNSLELTLPSRSAQVFKLVRILRI